VKRRLQEEAAKEGLQRHIWWKFQLPEEQTTLAYVSPVFNAVWVADSEKNFNAGPAYSKSNRDSDGFTLDLGTIPSPLSAIALETSQHLHTNSSAIAIVYRSSANYGTP
jgi:hypothetical protein